MPNSSCCQRGDTGLNGPSGCSALAIPIYPVKVQEIGSVMGTGAFHLQTSHSNPAQEGEAKSLPPWQLPGGLQAPRSRTEHPAQPRQPSAITWGREGCHRAKHRL